MWQRVWICLGGLINSEFVVTTNSDFTISFQDRDDRGCPFRECDWGDNVTFLEAIKFCFDFWTECIWHLTGPAELWLNIWQYFELSGGVFDETKFIFKN